MTERVKIKIISLDAETVITTYETKENGEDEALERFVLIPRTKDKRHDKKELANALRNLAAKLEAWV